MKGFDIYDSIDTFVGENSNFTFTYIGRENGNFKNTSVIAPLFGEDLGKCLSKYDVYVSGSLFDPGPNHVLESLSCRIPTYVYSQGGGCVEFAGKSHVYETFEDLEKILVSKKYKKNILIPDDWEECMSQYFKLFEEIVQNRNI